MKDLATGRVYISSQNHGYVVDMDKLDPRVAVPAFINVNDGTNEGLAYTGKNIFTVQYHPEACPGPQDSRYLFDRFIQMIRRSEAEEDQVMQQSMEPGPGGSAEERKNKQINPINNRDSDDRKEITSEKGGASHA